MGNTSIIARRLAGGKRVQFGWGGDGGYFRVVGYRLLAWYQDPLLVEYLFGFGQMRIIGIPGSEKGGAPLLYTHEPDGTPHWLGTSERDIFSELSFVYYGYFYDLDNRWYYIIREEFNIKVPLQYISNNLDESGDEFDESRRIERRLAEYILGEYYNSDEDFRSLVAEKYPQGIEKIRSVVLSEAGEGSHCERLRYQYRAIFEYFDNWAVAETNEDATEITGFLLHKNQDALGADRVETIYWGRDAPV